MQYSGTRGGRKSSTPALAHIHAAADDPDHSRRQREGQRWDQVCPQALAAASGQVRVKHLAPQRWAECSTGDRREELLLEVLWGTPPPPTPTRACKQEWNLGPFPPLAPNQGSGE